MRLLAILLAILFVGVLVTVWLNRRQSVDLRMPTPTVQSQLEQGSPQVRSELKWEPIFFKAIRERTSEAGLPDLRTVRLSDGDFEIRVWVGFGIHGEDGIILRHSSNQWSGVHLHGMGERPPFVVHLINLQAPRSGWHAAWQRLTHAGITTLPDALAINCNTHMFDGKSYVVEINKDSIYRPYLYDNPHRAPCREAKQILILGDIIADEFGLSEFKGREQ
jgi:hypothetical protein